MSDEIPFHIQEEIMKRLPVKSVIQFRSVSKAWKSLIDSSEFIAAHSLHHHTHPQHHLLVLFRTREEEINYVCFVDAETLFQQRPVPDSPLFVREYLYKNRVGTSYGLVCLFSPHAKVAILWNPSITKLIVVTLPNNLYDCDPYVGFGVCPVTTDPKIVAIKQSWDKSNMETSYKCEVSGDPSIFNVNSYTETLLLLGRSNCSSC